MSASEIRNIFRIGLCSTSDPESGTITVTFGDRENMVSGDLPVLSRGGWVRGNDLPEPGQEVACLFLANGISEGVCLGVIDDDDPPGTPDQRGIWYEDGSNVYYDQSTKQLVVKATGGVMIDGDVTIKGNLDVSGTVKRGGEII